MNKSKLKNNSRSKIIMLAILACLLWSTAFVGVKIGLKYSEPFYFAGIRFMLAGLLIIPFCGKFIDYIKTCKQNIKIIVLLAFLQTFVLYSFFYYTMSFTPAGLVAIVIGSSPLIIATTSHFAMHNDKMTTGKAMSLTLGILGVVILSISRKPWTGHGLKEFIGILLLLIGSLSSAFGNIIIAKNNKINPLIFNSAQIFIGGFFLLTLSLGIEGIPKPIWQLEFYIALFWLSLLSAVAFSIWFYLLTIPDIKISELNIWKFIIPICGAGLSWAILPDEHPDVFTLSGMFIITVSIVLFNYITLKNNSK